MGALDIIVKVDRPTVREAGKPGTNWKQVSPENRRKVAPLVRHYMKQPQPFTACVNDNTKRFGRERAERICAVVKDMGRRTTKWRKGGAGNRVREAGLDEDAFIGALFDEVMVPVLDAERVTVDELADWASAAVDAGVLEAAKDAPLSNARRRPGESAAAYGRRLKAGDRANERREDRKSKTRSGGDADFERDHPRARDGQWTLKQGSAGGDVREVQRRVGARVDGRFGEMTRRAVATFQRRNGLKVDGVVGRQTIAAMRGDKGAAKVAPGKATAKDREWLRERSRRRGGKVREAADGDLRPGTRVSWGTSQGRTTGRVVRKLTRPTTIKGFQVKASEASPRWLVRSDKTGEEAAHAASALTVLAKVRETAGSGALLLPVNADLRVVESALEVHEESALVVVEAATGGLVAQDLAVVEAAADAQVAFNADGTIDMVLMRPCVGQGSGWIYTADMLDANASVFAGKAMYDNHESEQAKRARQGLPRPPSELAGEIRESWFDPAFRTPDDGALDLDPGALVGRCMLVEDMEKLVRRLPRQVKTSVNAQGTGWRPGTRNGRRGRVLEGFVDDPDRTTVDLVTRAGAGGAVASLYRELAPA